MLNLDGNFILIFNGYNIKLEAMMKPASRFSNICTTDKC